ncbi:MAG TPA: hypothetical protein VN031_00270 [Candidatus Microsaccharimonas sp.]|nr:hypothetical protein [Candidatus Microsaccharimonas sp.]
MLWVCFWILLYFVLIIVLPPNKLTMQDYHLTGNEFRIFAALAGIPVASVWIAAFVGYSALASYAERVRTTREGQAYAHIARGLQWLAWSVPVSVCANTLLGGLANLKPSFSSAAFILSHYVYLGIALIAFTFMTDGTRRLREIINRAPSQLAIRGMMAIATLISVVYCTITLRTVQQQHPNSYHLPVWLILLTVIIPYLYAWLMGFYAVFEMSQYRRAVRGLFYKQPLRLLATGTICAIIASIALQYLTSTSRYLRRITLDGRLVALYLILFIFATGYIFIAVGAAKLKKIEEI